MTSRRIGPALWACAMLTPVAACDAEPAAVSRLALVAYAAPDVSQRVGHYDTTPGRLVLYPEFIAALNAAPIWVDDVLVVDGRVRATTPLSSGDVVEVTTAASTVEVRVVADARATHFRPRYSFK